MARSVSHRIPSIFSHLPSQKPSAAPLKPPPLKVAGKSAFPGDSLFGRRNCRRPLLVFAITRGGTSSLNAPLEPTSLPGRSLGGVLQNDPESFYDAVSAELSRLSDDRASALARMDLSDGSTEACLHRGSSVTVNWAPTKIQRPRLNQVYAASVMYGYFLKSISARHRLELNASESFFDIIPSNSWAFLFGSGYYGIKSIALGEFSTPRSTTLSQMQHPHRKPSRKLKSYLEGLDQDALQACAKMRSEFTRDLVEKHCSALLVTESSRSVVDDKPISTSLASLKRLVLEAIAFGCFLWDAEECVDRVFKLEK